MAHFNIWFSVDKSLESQVIARAYRMGATENVYVEQLVARHSIEELIVEMNKRDDPEYKDKKSNPQATTTGFLLSNATLIRPTNFYKSDKSINQDPERAQKTTKRTVKFSE